MQVRAPILEAVRGGESALAMAKRRYTTVLAFRNTHSAFVLDMNHAPYIKSECLDWKVSVRGSEVASH